MSARLLVSLSIAVLVAFVGATSGPKATVHDAGQGVVARMIEAHGGLEKWRSAPTVSFEDVLQPLTGPPLTSRVSVEQRSRRAYLDFPHMGARMAWDGERAWSENWQGPFPPRFFALLSYYFLNLPWLAADPGVNLSEPGTGRLWDDPTEYITVKMTFEPGVGDTPDDYYILYIDPVSYRLRAAELSVTYADILPPDVGAIEEIAVYDEFATVDGLVVPMRSSIYGKDRSLLASLEWRNWSFDKPFDESRMVMAADAVVDASSPIRRLN